MKSNRFLPEWLSSYNRQWLSFDLVAGLTASAVVIPKALAYATIAGLPVQIGLYTAFVPLVIYALLGSSRVLSVSTTTTIAILTAAELDDVVPNADPETLIKVTVTLTLLVGAVLVLAALLRLGFVASFISEPVLVGFKAAIGVVIVLDQIPKILGVHFPKARFLKNLVNLIRSMPETRLATLIVGLGVIVILLVMKHWLPKWPAPLIALGASIGAAYLFHLGARGVELVGHIPQGLPSISRPSLQVAEQLWVGALGIALMSFTETIAAGRAFAISGETPSANRELLATGLANIGGALIGAMPGGGGTSQTAVNRMAGAQTQVSELVTAAMALFTMLALAPLIGSMPQAALAAVVVVYSVGLIKPREFRAILRIRRTEFLWAIVAFAGVITFGTLRGIVVAIIVSLIALAYQVADPPVHVIVRKPGTNVFRARSKGHPDDESFKGLLILRIEGRMFFANAEHIAVKVRNLALQENASIIALDLSAVPDLEYTALKKLVEAEQSQRQLGKRIWLVGLNPQVLEIVKKSQLAKTLGDDGMHFNLELAVAKFLGLTTAA